MITILSRVQIRGEEDVEAMESQRRRSEGNMEFQHEEAGVLSQPEEESKPFVREGRKVGRNEPCPCGSGKKYKQCHGRLS